MQVKFFANRQISTGWFIPAGGKHKWGHTWQEPSEDDPPRLFATVKGARLALFWWLYGKWRTWPDGEIGLMPFTKRDPKDFQTVMVKLEVVKVGIRFVRRGSIES